MHRLFRRIKLGALVIKRTEKTTFALLAACHDESKVIFCSRTNGHWHPLWLATKLGKYEDRHPLPEHFMLERACLRALEKAHRRGSLDRPHFAWGHRRCLYLGLSPVVESALVA